MKVMFFCGDRYGARRALRIALSKGVEIVGCVFEEERPNRLSDLCTRNGIPGFTNEQMYEGLERKTFPRFDLGVSYLYHRLLKEPIIEFAEHNIINFHAAPIQVQRGVAGCCYCLLNGYGEWAVTAHYVAPGIDEGDVIMERWFPLEGAETAIDAESCIQKHLLELFEKVMDLFIEGAEIPREKQDLSSGHYFSRKELEQEKVISLSDPAPVIDKKINALWFPPYHGAYVEIGGEKYSLVNEKILKDIAALYQRVREISEQDMGS